ncbi:MAG: DNA repair protein RecN [Gammaproteobacteria bacterium]|nr:DNA repair protein RecN [Gammaproteobacteria bacterium]
MLTHLHIRDFAIIDAVELELGRGLCVLTGETGAGKSILVDALQLAVGARAGSEVIRHDAARAEVTATFDLGQASAGLRALLEEQSIEISDELLVRRVITREGKSRAYLNGQAVPVQVLREVGEWLAEIHGQHEFQSLVRPAAQRELLDRYAGAEAEAAEVARLHRLRLERSAALVALEAAARERDDRLDLLKRQVQELEALALKSGELATLTEERTRLANSGRLAEGARGALDLLYDAEDANAHALASRALGLLRTAGQLDPKLAALQPALDSALISLSDAAQELTRYLDNLEADPVRQAELEQRLASIESLARKHRVPAEQLPDKALELQAEWQRLEQLDANLAALQAALAEATAAWRKAAGSLSERRRVAAAKLASDISARMQTLGMAGGRFTVALQPLEASSSSAQGLEEVEFQVSANAGQPPRPLGKVASGGELSRLSLAVQVALIRGNESAQSVCMVFDEVDSGVGGAVAEIVGRELAALGARAQVLCVTHLPQVAALGDRHLRVAKLTDGHTTRTQITALEGAARTEEIARMLGGLAITDKAREHAAEMLAAGRRAPAAGSTRGATPAAAPSDADTAPSGSARKSRGRAR